MGWKLLFLQLINYSPMFIDKCLFKLTENHVGLEINKTRLPSWTDHLVRPRGHAKTLHASLLLLCMNGVICNITFTHKAALKGFGPVGDQKKEAIICIQAFDSNAKWLLDDLTGKHHKRL